SSADTRTRDSLLPVCPIVADRARAYRHLAANVGAAADRGAVLDREDIVARNRAAVHVQGTRPDRSAGGLAARGGHRAARDDRFWTNHVATGQDAAAPDRLRRARSVPEAIGNRQTADR